MNTCKECEHYEPYDGLEKSRSGKIAIMHCKNKERNKFFGHKGYHAVTARCSYYFTPKNPVEKSCGNCRFSRAISSKPCMSADRICHSDYSAWQPIKPDKSKAEVAEKKERDHQAHINLLNARLKRQKEHYQEQLLAIAEKPKETTYWDRGYSVTELRDPEKPKPLKSKENTMSRAKKLIRKYVMACTLYCTAVICVALNPWVYKLWHWLTPKAFDGKEGTMDWQLGEYAGHWIFMIASILLALIAIHAFNYITAYVFGKLEK